MAGQHRAIERNPHERVVIILIERDTMDNSGYSTETTLAAMAIARSCGGDMERIRPGLQTAIDNVMRDHKGKLFEAINNACGVLPEGPTISIVFENGAAWVEYENGDGTHHIDGGGMDLHEHVNEATAALTGS